MRRKDDMDAEICIVGAGPAGITLAREFIGCKTTVAIIESGGLNFDARIQELNEKRGQSVPNTQAFARPVAAR